MKNLFFWVLVVSIIPVYIILCVGLGWLWPIGSCENYERINQVLLNLSYSYMAGLIFYVLVTYLPYIHKKSKIMPSVRLKIGDIYKQINACLQTFDTQDRGDLIGSVRHERIIELINGADMYGDSFYAVEVGFNMTNLQFLVETRKQIFELIEQTLCYKEYLSGGQLLKLEKIHDSTYFHLTKINETTPTARLYYSHQRFKDEMIREFIPIMLYIKELKKDLKVTVSFES